MSETAPLARFVAKLERRGKLPAEERDALLNLPVIVRNYPAQQEVIGEGEQSTRSLMVQLGLISRTKTLFDGSRQIVSFGIPGDMIDLQTVLFCKADHGIHTHVPTLILSIAHTHILNLTAKYPIIARALWLDTLIDASIFRTWTANIGQRKALERTAHLLLEFAERYRAIGELQDWTFLLPLTQASLAEALGLSIVHVNRSLQTLRSRGYISTSDRSVTIHDYEAMKVFAGFDPDYLHIDGRDTEDAETSARA